MKKLILLMFAMTAIFGATPVIAESTGQKYTCPMHPEVVMDAPGKCPKCGMTLVPVETEKPKSSTQKPKAAGSRTPHAPPTADVSHISHEPQKSYEPHEPRMPMHPCRSLPRTAR